MLEAICFQTREVLEAMILDTAGMQHSTSCPDLDPLALEAAGVSSGGGLSGGLSRSRLGLNTQELLQQQQQQGGGGSGGGVALKARESSGDGGGGRVSISSWGSSQQLQQQGYRLNLLRVDGGASNNNLLMQLQVGEAAQDAHSLCEGG